MDNQEAEKKIEQLQAEIARMRKEADQRDRAETDASWLKVERDRAKRERDEARGEKAALLCWIKEIRENARLPDDAKEGQAVYKLAVIETITEELLRMML